MPVAGDFHAVEAGDLDVLADLGRPAPCASASRSVLGSARSLRATSSQNARKPSLRATKSVSQLISTRMPARAPGWMLWAITPSLASREAFLAAEAAPFLRRLSTAASRSPLVSVSAFLQSISPAPVISLSLPTMRR